MKSHPSVSFMFVIYPPYKTSTGWSVMSFKSESQFRFFAAALVFCDLQTIISIKGAF